MYPVSAVKRFRERRLDLLNVELCRTPTTGIAAFCAPAARQQNAQRSCCAQPHDESAPLHPRLRLTDLVQPNLVKIVWERQSPRACCFGENFHSWPETAAAPRNWPL